MQVCLYAKSFHSRPTLFDPMDYVACQAPLFMGILHARILEWVAMPFSRGSYIYILYTYMKDRPRLLFSLTPKIAFFCCVWEGLGVSLLMSSALAGWFFITSTSWDAI